MKYTSPVTTVTVSLIILAAMLTLQPVLAGDNLVKNGDFSDGAAHWAYIDETDHTKWPDSVASGDVTDGKLHMSAQNPYSGPTYWQELNASYEVDEFGFWYSSDSICGGGPYIFLLDETNKSILDVAAFEGVKFVFRGEECYPGTSPASVKVVVNRSTERFELWVNDQKSCESPIQIGAPLAIRWVKLAASEGCMFQTHHAYMDDVYVHGRPGLTCSSGLANCDGDHLNGCEVDIRVDTHHCGVCGTACTGGRYCSEGSCACAPNTTVCSDACVDTTTGMDNCGSCANACKWDETCVSGQCQVAAWWDDAWEYRRRVVLNEAIGRSRTQEPVNLTFSLSDMARDDCADVRLVDAAGQEVVSAVIGCTGGNGTLWFQSDVPATGSAVYYLYYGNAGATAPVYSTPITVTTLEEDALYKVTSDGYYVHIHKGVGPNVRKHPGLSVIVIDGEDIHYDKYNEYHGTFFSEGAKTDLHSGPWACFDINRHDFVMEELERNPVYDLWRLYKTEGPFTLSIYYRIFAQGNYIDHWYGNEGCPWGKYIAPNSATFLDSKLPQYATQTTSSRQYAYGKDDARDVMALHMARIGDAFRSIATADTDSRLGITAGYQVLAGRVLRIFLGKVRDPDAEWDVFVHPVDVVVGPAEGELIPTPTPVPSPTPIPTPTPVPSPTPPSEGCTDTGIDDGCCDPRHEDSTNSTDCACNKADASPEECQSIGRCAHDGSTCECEGGYVQCPDPDGLCRPVGAGLCCGNTWSAGIECCAGDDVLCRTTYGPDWACNDEGRCKRTCADDHGRCGSECHPKGTGICCGIVWRNGGSCCTPGTRDLCPKGHVCTDDHVCQEETPVLTQTPTPTVAPTPTATPVPTPIPTPEVTFAVTVVPTSTPVPNATAAPTIAVTLGPTLAPALTPTLVTPYVPDGPSLAPSPSPSPTADLPPVGVEADQEIESVQALVFDLNERAIRSESVLTLLAQARRKMETGDYDGAARLATTAREEAEGLLEGKKATGAACDTDEECTTGNCNIVCCLAGQTCCESDAHCYFDDHCDWERSYCVTSEPGEGPGEQTLGKRAVRMLLDSSDIIQLGLFVGAMAVGGALYLRGKGKEEE